MGSFCISMPFLGLLPSRPSHLEFSKNFASKIFCRHSYLVPISGRQRLHRQRGLASKARLVQDLQVQARTEMGPVLALSLPCRSQGKEERTCSLLHDISGKISASHSRPGCLHSAPSHWLLAKRLVLGQPDLQSHDCHLHHHYGPVP